MRVKATLQRRANTTNNKRKTIKAMKKILITGANSYIGTSFEKYITEYFSDKYTIDTVDMMDDSWRQKSFSEYDAVYHVAGIAHSDIGKITVEKEQLYRSINTELTIETAKKAKADGAKQFIFMSSSIVYGNSAPIGKEKIINKETPVSPFNCYGDSKVQAEKGLLQLNDESFKVVILRSPMVYGKGNKGNFQSLEKIAKKARFFPYITNQRSMLYIGNLVEFVRLMIENGESGIFWPQNTEYVNTSELVKAIATANNKKCSLIRGLGWALKLLSFFTPLVNKAFGNLCYSADMSVYKQNYQRYTLNESVVESEK